ncbi:TetR/AcrR family transcriptional regulator [Cohnella hongkongensis]|uniref:TetR-like C-terminal domain-containing protein n=1 Tax=Cohnella hongkongensis TaxID=178337 RepID=A0ABV9FC31_9BACL
MYHINADPRSVQSKTMLYRALSQRMKEKNFQSITVKEVVHTAQIGRSTFYRNFDSLEDILQWKCDESFHALYGYIVQSIASQAVRTSDKFPFILPFFRYWHADSEIVELLIAANRIDIVFSAFEDTMKKLVLRLRPAMTKLSPQFDYFLAFRSGAIIRILLQWIQNGKNLSPEDMHRFIESQSEGFIPQME